MQLTLWEAMITNEKKKNITGTGTVCMYAKDGRRGAGRVLQVSLMLENKSTTTILHSLQKKKETSSC